jgi:hypothetical protein
MYSRKKYDSEVFNTKLPAEVADWIRSEYETWGVAKSESVRRMVLDCWYRWAADTDSEGGRSGGGRRDADSAGDSGSRSKPAPPAAEGGA